MENRKAPIQTSNPLVDELFFNSMQISDELLEQILALPRNELIRDLERIINFAIDNFDEVQLWDNKKEDRTAFAIHAVFLLTELKAEESFPLILKISRCSDDLLDFYFGDYPTECMWQDALVLGFNRVAAFVEFFKDGGGSFAGNCIVSGGLTQLFLHYPEKQDEIVSHFKDLLDFLYRKNHDEDDLELNEVVLNAIADTKNAELFSLCKPFYDEERTLREMTSDWEEFEDIQLSMHSYKRNFLTLRQRLNFFVRMQNIFETIKATPQPVFNETKAQRNDPCPCGSGLKFKKCCLNKEHLQN